MSGTDKFLSEIVCNPLTYYQKPAIGQDDTEQIPPAHLVFPTGGVGLGVAPRVANRDQNRGVRHGVIVSGPVASPLDTVQKRGLVFAFNVLAIVNIVLTCLLYLKADEVDSSKVEPATSFLPFSLEKVDSERRPIEKISFGFTITIIVIGILSTITEFTLGVSIYSLAIILNFMLGTSALPYFVYSFRYILDIGMLYLALVIRSRLMYTFLPLHIQ
jgi:hypothetical protein